MKFILFINPPNKLFNEQKSLESGLDQPGIPLGCLSLSSYLKNLFPGLNTKLLPGPSVFFMERGQPISIPGRIPSRKAQTGVLIVRIAL
jgi:hypothetical protein